jgi:hypothetical protein
VSQPTSARQAPATGERRVYLRFPCSQAAFCRALQPPNDIFWTARARNVSVAGVRLVLGHPFNPGTLLAVEIINTAQSLARELPVRVVYAHPESAHSWAIGCEFVTRLSDAELFALL